MTEDELRKKVIEEALTWLGTPYHIGARIKGVGADCATFILQVFVDSGIFTDERLGNFSGDWWCHATDEKYAIHVLRHAHKVLESVCYRSLKIKPGSIVLGRVTRSKVLNHGAIVIDYPKAIHCIAPRVCLTNLSIDALWSYVPIEVFDPFQERKPE
jgi:cell wall-associated NlpC family hydrolase